jgi:hypothetical protein
MNDEYPWMDDNRGGVFGVLALYAGLVAAGMRLLVRPAPTKRTDR